MSKRLQWGGVPDVSSPKSPVRDTLVVYGVLSLIILFVAWVTGGPIGRALVSRPTIVFADEPTGNLDSRTSGEILDLLNESVHDLAQTIVMVTHEARAAAIAERILFLADGKIVKESRGVSAQDVVAAMDELDAS